MVEGGALLLLEVLWRSFCLTNMGPAGNTPSVPSADIGACGSVAALPSPIGKGERVAAVVGKRRFYLDALWCPFWSPNRFE